MPQANSSPPPVATPAETVNAILSEGGRDHTPVRISFLQRSDGKAKWPGPLAEFVTNGDLRGLLLYLLLIAKATTAPWDAALPSAVWARALGVPLPNSKGAGSSISKTWLRLAQRNLVSRERSQRMARITLLREDGSGLPYSHPGTEGGYFKLPHAFWREGPAPAFSPWYQVLTMPEVAMLLIACSHRARFRLPLENAPEWYGISADTASRGLHGLEARNALLIDRTYKTAPLAPAGYTSENRYTLRPPFGHRRDLTTGLTAS
jgi:hypothetical protein